MPYISKNFNPRSVQNRDHKLNSWQNTVCSVKKFSKAITIFTTAGCNGCDILHVWGTSMFLFKYFYSHCKCMSEFWNIFLHETMQHCFVGTEVTHSSVFKKSCPESPPDLEFLEPNTILPFFFKWHRVDSEILPVRKITQSLQRIFPFLRKWHRTENFLF